MKAGAPRPKRTRDPEAVTRREVTIGGIQFTMYDGVDTPPPRFRWIDIAEAMKPGEAIVVERGIDRDRITAAIRQLYGSGKAVSKQRGDEIWVWRVKETPLSKPRKRA